MRKTRSKSPAPRTRAAKATTSAAVRGSIPRNKPAHAVAKLRFSNFSLGRLRRWLLCELAGKVFAEVDTNGDGRLDAAELYAGVLLVYMHVAAYVYIRPPSRQAVLAELAELDEAHAGALDAAEFECFVVWLTAGLVLRAAAQFAVMLVVGPLLSNGIVRRIDEEWGAGGAGATKSTSELTDLTTMHRPRYAAEEWLSGVTGVHVPQGTAVQLFTIVNIALLTPRVLGLADSALLWMERKLQHRTTPMPAASSSRPAGSVVGRSAKSS